MRLPASLRWRVVAASTGLGAVLSVLFAVLVMGALEVLEVEFTGRVLQDELDYFVAHHEAHPGSAPPASHAMRGYVVTRGDHRGLPEALADLAPGPRMTEVYIDGREHHVAVTDVGPRRYYLAYDFALFEAREAAVVKMVIGVAAVSLALSIWLGLWLSGRVLLPVQRLARRVSAQAAGGGVPARRFAEECADDEVGTLAQAFDAYVVRLDAFVQRERQFTAEASHELRTPLAVLSSTVEVLLADGRLDGAVRERLMRLQRGVTSMGEVVEALLALARADSVCTHESPARVAEVLGALIEEYRPLLAHRPVRLRAELDPDSPAAGPAGMLRIVLGNVLRNAVSYTARGNIAVRLCGWTVTVEDTGLGIDEADQELVFQRRFRAHNAPGEGAGLGLAIVKRACERCGWEVSLASTPGVGTRVRIDLAPSAG